MTRKIFSVCSCVAFAAGSTFAQPLPSAPPAPLDGFKYDADFFPGSHHDANVPTPDSVLGFRLGDKPVTHAQVEAVVKAIAAKSPRVKLFEYAKSHEGRTLYYLAVTSQANIQNLDQIKADAAKLADPRKVSPAETDHLVDTLPGIAWMAYVIHGDEMSGTDAALSFLWHLASCTDAEVTSLLEHTVVLIDPLMNPDGRDRCLSVVAQMRTVQPDVDDQSNIHAEVWPSGRMNHYLFDMNRDWIWGTQPESRGRIQAAGSWNPHYFVESHEQEPQSTFLFMPPRAPINPNIAESIHKWSTAFGDDQAKAFDKEGWRYFTGEWNEEWYPGYSGSWAALRGAIDNLYEQARTISDGVRRGEGAIEAYREAVHKQLVSSMANLRTLAERRKEILRDFADDHRKLLAADGPYGDRRFIVSATANGGRMNRLKDLLDLQGIEYAIAPQEFTVSGRDWLGREFKDRKFPAGSLSISPRQPQGRIAAALFELDPRMSQEFLTDERRELLRFGQSRLYDITAWNAAMMYGLETVEVHALADVGTGMAAEPAKPAPAPASDHPPVALVFDGADDRSVAVAARLMDLKLHVRVLNKATTLGIPLSRGTILVTRKDNQAFPGDWNKLTTDTAKLFGLTPQTITTGMGPGDLPDIGGEHFLLLERPRIALLTHASLNPYTVGEIWHLLDHEMGVRASYIQATNLSGSDLRRYNVLVIPDGGPEGWAQAVPAIKSWVEAGGTLIAIGGSASVFAKDKEGIGSTRLLPDVLTKLDDYRAAIVRDWLGKSTMVEPVNVWANVVPGKLEYPWTLGETDKPSDEEAKRRDEWRSLFGPQGALLATRVDDRHWMTAGCGDVLPVVVGQGPVLLAKNGGNAPLLLGAIVAAPEAPKKEADAKSDDAKKDDEKKSDDKKPAAAKDEPKKTDEKKDDAAKEQGKDGAKKDDGKKDDKKEEKKEEPKPGWTVAPPGFELRLRMSGLLWPEAADRLAHSAYATQERIGAGQIILFCNSPTFRGAARGSTRVLMNAMIIGPGAGANPPIIP